jgi:hypothetical protein
MTSTTETTVAKRDLEKEPLFLTPAETAAALGITTDELREMRATGVGPRFATLGERTILYWRELTLEWEETHRLVAA